MATTFSSLYGYIRALVGDIRAECYLYGDTELTGYIRTAALLLNSNAIMEDSGLEVFTTDLTRAEQLKVAIQSAISILDPQPVTFEHASPILRIRRSTPRDYVMKLENKLKEVSGNRFAIRTDTEFRAILNSFDRWYKDYNDGTA